MNTDTGTPFTDDASQPDQKKKAVNKGRNFTKAEDAQLIASWLEIEIFAMSFYGADDFNKERTSHSEASPECLRVVYRRIQKIVSHNPLVPLQCTSIDVRPSAFFRSAMAFLLLFQHLVCGEEHKYVFFNVLIKPLEEFQSSIIGFHS